MALCPGREHSLFMHTDGVWRVNLLSLTLALSALSLSWYPQMLNLLALSVGRCRQGVFSLGRLDHNFLNNIAYIIYYVCNVDSFQRSKLNMKQSLK